MIWLSFTAPPSTNNLYASVRGKRVRTGRYKTWQQVAGWEVVAAYPDKQHIEGPFCLSIWLPPGLDLDNGVKAVADLLGPGKHGLGITEDDRQMVELHVYRDRTTKGTCRVRIEARQ